MPVTIDGTTGVTTPGISNSEGYSGDGLSIAAGAPAGAVTIDAAGNAGLGVTPSAWDTTYKALQISSRSMVFGAGNETCLANNAYFNGGYKYVQTNSAGLYIMDRAQHAWYTAPSGTAGNAISFTQAMTLDASGNLLVGTTSATGKLCVTSTSGDSFSVNTSGAFWSASLQQNNAGTQYFNEFKYGATRIGSIQGNNTSTSYNTSSDYRLKENIQPMTGALAKVALLKPCTYKWKADGSDGEGFIAHELAEVVPQCVTGEKDAVDADGKPVYQGIDTSFLVATLTAALQELKAIVDQQAIEIANLKGQA